MCLFEGPESLPISLITKVIPLKLSLDHFRIRKSQEGAEIANPVTRHEHPKLLCTLCYPPRKHPLEVCETSAGKLGTMSNNLRRITLGKKVNPIARLYLL